MRVDSSLLSLAILGAIAACGSVPSETSPPPGGREVAPAGVIRGTVVYSGPHPCSSDGHVTGAAIVLVFDRRNPPPPNGLASTAINFGVVTGDVLFANEPRYAGKGTYCPLLHGIQETVTVSAEVEISPLDGGSYMLAAFYDYTGDFLPGFKFRNLPELGDIAGGDIDTADALKPINAGNPDYQPHFLPVDVGIPQPLPAGAPSSAIPSFRIPGNGFVANNVTITLGEVLPTTRPYFYPIGLSATFDAKSGSVSTSQTQTSAAPGAGSDPNYQPVLTIPQDLEVLAPPQNLTPQSVANWESSFPHLLLKWGVPSAELPLAQGTPFHFQLVAGGGFSVWQNATFDTTMQLWVPQQIPEGQGVPNLWPLVVLNKLADDPQHQSDPSSLKTQGSSTAPSVVLQAITLLGGSGGAPDTLQGTRNASAGGSSFDPKTGRPTVFTQDHLTVLLRPAVICFDSLFDPSQPDKRGTLVTPFVVGLSADLPAGKTNVPIVPVSALSSPQIAGLVNGSPLEACLPTGRYTINVVYPDGQAWTVPNETGSCSGAEGSTDYARMTCTLQPRNILYSQGNRAVVEIVQTKDPTHCTGGQKEPAACLPR
jgi:hypothetical protein